MARGEGRPWAPELATEHSAGGANPPELPTEHSAAGANSAPRRRVGRGQLVFTPRMLTWHTARGGRGRLSLPRGGRIASTPPRVGRWVLTWPSASGAKPSLAARAGASAAAMTWHAT